MTPNSNPSSTGKNRGSFWALLLTSLTVIAGVTLSAGLVWAAPASLCADEAALKVANDPANYLAFSEINTFTKGVELILIGEIHRTHYAFREPLMKRLRDSRKGRACQLFELDRAMTIDEHLKVFSEPGFEEVHHHIGRVRDLAKNLGLKSYTVDTESSPEDTSVEEINRRDREMAARIHKLLRTKCDSAIMFVGKAHMVNEKEGRKNLTLRLRQAGVKVLAINLQDPNDDRMTTLWGEDDAATAQSWNGMCRKGRELPRPSSPAIFLNAKLNPHLRMWPKTHERGVWGSFDLTILAPDPDLQ